MRRKDREVTQRDAIRKILEDVGEIRLGFAVENEPYIVTMNFGFVWEERLRLYMHCAREGKKIDMMHRNNRVCFQADTGHELVIDDLSCRWTMNYSSVVGWGVLSIVTDEAERIEGLNTIMKNYGKKGESRFAAEKLQETLVLRLDADEMSAKRKA